MKNQSPSFTITGEAPRTSLANHQLKSRWYYVFWSIATVSVFAGQLYVGTGYREMANQQKAFAQVIYDQQMGWGARQQAEEMKANRPLNQTGEYE
jgi:hypothetical protein